MKTAFKGFVVTSTLACNFSMLGSDQMLSSHGMVSVIDRCFIPWKVVFSSSNYVETNFALVEKLKLITVVKFRYS